MKYTLVRGNKLKGRSANAQSEYRGINHVKSITEKAGHIFRPVYIEDVGIDAHIEICRKGKEPSGKQIGFQIKSGESYIKAEKSDSFIYYPDDDDLQYWKNYSIPVYLIVFNPKENQAYWFDITRYLKDSYSFEKIIIGTNKKKLTFNKNNIFSDDFLNQLETRYGFSQEYYYDLFLHNLNSVSITGNGFLVNENIDEILLCLNASSSKKLLGYLEREYENLLLLLIQKSISKDLAVQYLQYLECQLFSIIFELEKTYYLFFAFEEKETKNNVLKIIEEIIPFNKYLILEGERILPDLLMNYSILLAFNYKDNLLT